MITANQTKYEFLVAYDKLFEYGAPAYDDKQISSILNKAQWRVFSATFKQGFELTEEVAKDLDVLIKPASLSGGTITVSSDQTGIHPNGTFYDLPDDFYLALEEAATTAEKATEVKVLPITHDFYLQNINNPYKNPNKDLIWRMNFSRENAGEDGGDEFTGLTPKRVELIVKNKTSYPVTNYRLRYIKNIPDIVCDEITPENQKHCVLQSLIYDIIDEAVKIATASTKPDEYQISMAERNSN